jgi:hypothetical protein
MSSSPSATPEIIAVVLPDGSALGPAELCPDNLVPGTLLMLRHADGRLSLEAPRRDHVWPTSAPAAGSPASRRRPILDPISREVVGYEMELAIAS